MQHASAVSKAYTGPTVPVRLRFAALHAAWGKVRRGKRPSSNHLAFASRWLDALQTLHQQLRAGTWLPRRTVSFVVRHWLVVQLERLYEPLFIHDSYANRADKRSHAAVDRLHAFMRQRNGRGWFLQLDVHNFFNSIHRPTLYAQLKHRIAKHTARAARPAGNTAARSLLDQPVQEWCANPAAAAQVPPHKRLRNAPTGCGLPIGNLTSQFFANVYLNELDQFVKHTLKARHYVRYVDDFVLLADDAATLQRWQADISQYLQDRLRLRLKTEHHLAPLEQGVDFLGYVLRPSPRRWPICSTCWPAIGATLPTHAACGCAMRWCSALAGCARCFTSTRRATWRRAG